MDFNRFAVPDIGERDPLFDEAARLIIEHNTASASFLQRKMNLGYARSARILDELYQAGVIGPVDGASPRKILVTDLESFKRGLGTTAETLGIDLGRYRIPKIKLTRPGQVPWGKPLSELEWQEFEIPIGLTEQGELVSGQLDNLSHLGVVGNPASAKMAFLDTLLVSQLVKLTPQQLQLILMDESGYLNLYANLPHLLSPVICDPQTAVSALRWTRYEIHRRQKLFAEAGVRRLDRYQEIAGTDPLPRILVVYRTFSMDQAADAELRQITSYGQAAGVHLIFVADQLSTRYISPSLKANLPDRLVFQVSSPSDSSLAGVKGADKLGVGEALLTLPQFDNHRITTVYSCERNVNEVVSEIQQAI